MKMESTLSLIDLNGNKVPMLAFSFEDVDGAKCVADFEPKRVLLAESKDEHYYLLVDEEGFEYARVKRSEEWIKAAITSGIFVLSMRTPLPQSTDRVGGRILMIQFPFGQVLQDSGTFAIRGEDLDRMERSRDAVGKLKDSAAEALKRLATTTKLPN
jgi:hypothetical protein